MSFSFIIKAATKDAAKAAVAVEWDKVCGYQACHQRDKAPVLAVAGAFIDLLTEQPGKAIQVNLSGSLSGQWEGSDVTRISSANLTCTAFLVPAHAV